METNELKIIIPKGQEINWQESAKQKKIVFKKKDNKPRSWKEYCHTRLDSKETRFGYHIGNMCEIVTADWDNVFNCSTWRDVLPSKELAKAFLAMMQLMSLRQAWVGDWEPDWNNVKSVKWCITQCQYEFKANALTMSNKVLSFPTQEMATDFMKYFKDLLEVAKPLI